MGFMSAMGKAFKAPLKAPGMGAITKPLNKTVGQPVQNTIMKPMANTVGKIPGIPGGPPRQGPPPIGPSPNMQGNSAWGPAIGAGAGMAQALGGGQGMMRRPMPAMMRPMQGPPPDVNPVSDMNAGGAPMMMAANRGAMAQDAPPDMGGPIGMEQGPPDPQMQQMIQNRMAAMQQQQRPMGPTPGMMGGMMGQGGPMRRPMPQRY